MSDGRTPHPPSDDDRADLEERLERFDAAWRGDTVPAIEVFLPPRGAAARQQVLHELIKIDLEYRWRIAAPQPAHATTHLAASDPGPGRGALPACPRLEDYAACLPDLGRVEELPLELIAEEYRVRHAWGDRPEPAEYARRFAGHGAALQQLLARVDVELAAEAVHTVREPDPRCRLEARGPRPARSLSTTPLLSQVGRYQLKEGLGAGAFGSVWRGWDMELQREVAVKLPHARRFVSSVREELFLREARSAARLQHPGIVAVHDVGRDRDTIYIVADLVPGVSLRDWLAERRSSFREAADLVARLADILDYAHRQGVIHRDLKPANILI
jgi:hypothetical protein